MPIGKYKHKTIAEGRKPGGGKKGNIPWNKGTHIAPPSSFMKGEVSAFKGMHHSEESKRKNREARLGNKYPNRKRPPSMSEETRKKISLATLGKKKGLRKSPSTEARIHMSIVHKRRVAEGLHNNYKGGITPINLKIRGSLEYRLWRESVFTKDNWTCVWCGKKGGRLNADHIKPFALFPELRFAIDNGRTLCVDCHRLSHSNLTIR